MNADQNKDNESLSKHLLCVSDMPALRHKPGKQYRVEDSEVVAWLVKQPGVLEWLWNRVAKTGIIAFNDELGAWQGIGREAALARYESSGKGRPSKWSITGMLSVFSSEAVKAGGGKVSNAYWRKVMATAGMPDNTYYRLRKLAEAAGRVVNVEGQWQLSEGVRIVEPVLPAKKNSSKVIGVVKSARHEKVRMTEDQITKLLAACELPEMKLTKHPEFIAIHLIENWIEKNVLNRKSIDIHEIYDITNSFLDCRGIPGADLYGFKVRHQRLVQSPPGPPFLPPTSPGLAPAPVAPEDHAESADANSH